MKHKTLFRLLLKALGVWLIVPGVAEELTFVTWLFHPQAWSGNAGWALLIQSLGPLVKIAAGLYLFFGGKWIADLAIPSNRPYCHECGYDLTGAAGDVCNECGTPFRAPEIVRHE